MMELFSLGRFNRLISHAVLVRTAATGGFDKTVKLWDISEIGRKQEGKTP